jgi:hypothetical protein
MKVKSQPPQDVVKQKTCAGNDIKKPEYLIMRSEHQWKDTNGDGRQHDIIVNTRQSILFSWFDDIINPLEYVHE